MRDVFWGGRFLPYRRRKVNKAMASGKHERLSPTPEIVVMTQDRGCGVSIHGWTIWGVFFPGPSTSHTKNVTNGYLDTLSFWGTKIAVQRPSDLFRVGCPHSTDSELCGHTRHVNQFHHVISQLCPKIGPLISRCFLKVNKIGLSDSIFVESRKTL